MRWLSPQEDCRVLCWVGKAEGVGSFHVSSRLVTLQGTLRTVLSGFGTLLACGAPASTSPTPTPSPTPTLGYLLGLGAAESGWLWGTGPRPRPGKGVAGAVTVAGATRGLALAAARRRLGGGARLVAVRGAAVPAARLACRGFAATCVGLKR